MDARTLLLFGDSGGGGGHTGERGHLHIDGIRIVREDGSTFPFRGADSYSLYHRFLLGQDIRPVLNELVGLGFNVLRVFSMYNEFGIGNVNGLGRLHPGLPEYWEQWPAFATECASVGLRLEVVLLADAQDIMPNEAVQQMHVDRLYDLLEPHWNVSFVETCNEPHQNGVDLDHVVPRKGLILRASGTSSVDDTGRIPNVLDYVTTHTERKFEWPRTCRALGEIRDGAENLEAVNVPVVSDEPTGFAEQARPESRSGPGYHPADSNWTHLDDARVYAAGCQMFGAGSTFHSDDGVSSRLLGPEQKKAAVAWLQGAMWMPVEAQFAEYQRGGFGGGPGFGNMPINHHDLDESVEPRALRTYAKRAEGVENCVAIRRSAGWFPEMLRGCTLINEWFPGLAKVREP